MNMILYGYSGYLEGLRRVCASLCVASHHDDKE